MENFYKYIYKKGEHFEIKKGNEKFGTYRKLSDALYERDRLIESDWDWDDSLQLEETENPYENLDLPEFNRDYSYITKLPESFFVFDGREFIKRYYNLEDAEAFAKPFNGKVVKVDERYRVQKSFNGKTRYFGQYKTLDEAITQRDKLIENRWEL